MRPPTEVAVLTNSGVHIIKRRLLIELFDAAIRYGMSSSPISLEAKDRNFLQSVGKRRAVPLHGQLIVQRAPRPSTNCRFGLKRWKFLSSHGSFLLTMKAGHELRMYTMLWYYLVGTGYNYQGEQRILRSIYLGSLDRSRRLRYLGRFLMLLDITVSDGHDHDRADYGGHARS